MKKKYRSMVCLVSLRITVEAQYIPDALLLLQSTMVI